MSLFVYLNNCVPYSLTSLHESFTVGFCSGTCTIIPGRRFMYPNLNIFSGIANTKVTRFAKIVVYPLLLTVSTDVFFMFHENSCCDYVLKGVSMSTI
jgi:hypothetical protein